MIMEPSPTSPEDKTACTCIAALNPLSKNCSYYKYPLSKVKSYRKFQKNTLRRFSPSLRFGIKVVDRGSDAEILPVATQAVHRKLR